MKKIYVYPGDIKSGVIIPSNVDVMAYEEYEGDVRITLFFEDATHIIATGKEKDIWDIIDHKAVSFPEYYNSLLDIMRKKVEEEKNRIINSTYTPLFIETDTPRKDGWTETQIQGVIQQYNLLDISELVEDRIHFEESLALLNNMGKRYRLQIYNNSGEWHTVIVNNDSPYPSFSIALHVFLNKLEYYMTKNTKDVEYKDF